MTKKYLISVVAIGALVLGWAWINQPESAISANNAPAVDGAPVAAAPAQPKNNSGTPDF